MARYFLEVAYHGKNYAGFQIQQNANTVQAEIEKALAIFFKQTIELTGSSRTDAGVHAAQNYFHFDYGEGLCEDLPRTLYHLNAILPKDIVARNITLQLADAHARFDAKSREYAYRIYSKKDPFLADYAYYFPYPLNVDLMQESADIIRQTTDFQAFSKKNTQVYTFQCHIEHSVWEWKKNEIVYTVRGSRFLRGMVRGLVGTMLKVGTGKLSIASFRQIIIDKNPSKVDFSVPAHALTLQKVNY